MKIYQNIIRKMLFRFDSEKAHNFGIRSLKTGLSSEFAQNRAYKKFGCEGFGEIDRFGLNFKNPLGIAAGFDKNASVVNQLAAIGFGFVEVGTVTFEAQSGNEKPRMFRLPEDSALINRLGFNNVGTPKVVERLRNLNPKCVLGVNIGKNKNVPNEEAVENYLKSFDLAYEVADYITVNISSPNTPNLRELQKSENLEDLLAALQERNKALSPAFRRNLKDEEPPKGGTQNKSQQEEPPKGGTQNKSQQEEPPKGGTQNKSQQEEPPKGGTQNMKPLLVKIAPDLDEEAIEAITDISMRLKVSGIIATNTTISRKGLKTDSRKVEKIGNGGVSGKPIAEPSNEVIAKIYKDSKGNLPIIGVGGIFTAEDAFDKIVSGASLLQAYTGFVYQGVSFARDVNFGLVKLLKAKGFNSLDEAVGSGVDV